ncbi:carboxypeptidase-like regulatory domain-containing protein [Aurantibacter crassamenti]|uniref:carboxypeptidase-like regulatory domain-containing protein n=1 Tax=Aurantibacter crassamenti TaxID=1837375 RepID=UPI001939D7E8|nr:carboxypeptidase-like regulatory domain-containing protein [Aurantibacter crassamenti]MBM1105421.1 carboxypeptidase-like regulatory domain-containing protein [Aurantibacter crassamenti]
MKILLVFATLLFATSVFAQNGAIRGTVLDQEMNNEPLLFANISLKGAKSAEQTNLFGNFEINDVVPGEYTIQISFAGYDTKEILIRVKADETTEIQETLTAITFDYDEVSMETTIKNEDKIVALSTIADRK